MREDPHFDREIKLFLPDDPRGQERLDDKEFEITGAITLRISLLLLLLREAR